MRTHLASARAASGLARVDLDVRRLEERWDRDGDVSLAEFWQDCQPRAGRRLDGADAVRLGALIKADLRRRFERDESVPVTDYLEAFPGLRDHDSRVVSLIYEEYCLREERGQSLDVASFCARYPDWKDSLASQLQYHRLFSRAAGLVGPSPRYPEVGGNFEEFRLLSLIGKGGSSRVYLASDQSLGGKQVVLKVSMNRGEEPKTMGSLDHPHIVPVHSVVFEDGTDLRGLTMPYRPGLPLDEMLRRLPGSARGRTARDIWKALIAGLVTSGLPLTEEHRAALEQEKPAGDGWEGFPTRGSFARGVAWIGMILARTLNYAHRRQTFHRDVKPGNVLLTLHHGPQLLDFNLAESPHSANHAQSAMLGGTLPYMAPEQIEAFLNPDLWDKVDARSDIYSLGLVLRELLTGIAPDLPDEKLPPARAMRELLDRRVCLTTDVGQSNAEVPYALRAIVSLCLKLDPAERYPDAGALAEDLARFLKRQPLATAQNASVRERSADWLVRRRRDLAYGAAGAAFAALVGWVIFPWVAQRMKPDPTTLPLMERAVRIVNSDQAGKAIPVLGQLAVEYPDHPLPWIYRGIARSRNREFVHDEAQADIELALSKPDAAAVLLDWGRSHPELVTQVVGFVDNQIEALNRQKLRANNGGNRVLEDKLHGTWLALLQLGMKLDPQSLELRQKLPEVDEYFGQFESAYRRLSELIRPLEARDLPEQRLALLEWRNRRNRVAVKWARALHRDRDRDTVRRASKLLEQAVDDLAASESYIREATNKSNERPSGEQAQFIYNHYWIGTETWLTLAKLNLDEGRPDEADGAYRKANTSLRKLVEHGNNALISHPPRLKDLEEQVRAGLRRLADRG